MDTPDAPPPPGRAPSRKARRLNADYRWTMPKVLAFLDALATCGSVAEAARAVGMSRQSAYRMRARLAGTRFSAAFDGARRQGIRARAEASKARLRSKWDGEGLGDWLARQGAGAPAPGNTQGDGSAAQGVTPAAQRDAAGPQGDACTRQGDASARKATVLAPGPCNIRSMPPADPPRKARNLDRSR